MKIGVIVRMLVGGIAGLALWAYSMDQAFDLSWFNKEPRVLVYSAGGSYFIDKAFAAYEESRTQERRHD